MIRLTRKEKAAARRMADDMAALSIKLYSRGEKALGWMTSFTGGGFVDLIRPPGYTGPNRKLGDYYVRELRRIGTGHRQVVEFEVVGTGRTERMARSEFERRARPA